MSPRDDLPRSRTRRRPQWLSPIWLVPVLAGAVAGYLVHRKLASEGPEVRITFLQAGGVSAGKTDVRYRGVTIGTVESVRLSDDFRETVVVARLRSWASGMARAGAKFWIVRPEVSAAGVHGLLALVSGNYIEARPGRGAETDRFTGLEEAPVEKYQKRDLEIVLTSDSVGTIKRGTPVFYRGMTVGDVNDVRLSPDARGVRISVLVSEGYRPLVRDNSVLWNEGGVDVHFGLLHGLDVRAKSIQTLMGGGIGLATPDSPGQPVKDGHVFPLHSKAQDAWTKWSPRIELKGHPVPVREPAGARRPD